MIERLMKRKKVAVYMMMNTEGDLHEKYVKRVKSLSNSIRANANINKPAVGLQSYCM